MKSNELRLKGFTLVEIMIVVAIIGLLATIAVPNWVRARTASQRNACINNLRQIDGAVQTWALEYKKAPTDPVTYPDISGFLKNTVICPAGGTAFSDSYTISTVTNKPTCQKQPGAGNHELPVDTTQ
jgi:prepilin-type N-terminal cleavage/methylation domain-containing protein